MLNLILTTDKLQLTRSSTADVDVQVSGADCDNTTPTAQVFVPFKENATFNTGATGDISAVPASNHFKNIKFISIVNRHAATSNNVTVLFNANGTTYQLTNAVTLAAGESLVCREGVWFHYDIYGGVYGPSLPIASDTVVGAIQVAATGDMVAGSSTVLAVTPGRQQSHPGHPKAWVSCGVAADIQQSFNVASLTDNGTGDVTVTFTAAFAAATYHAQVTVEMTTTTYTVANARTAHIRSGGRATGSCRFDCIDGTVTTQLIKDPTTWHVAFFGGQ